MMCLMQLIYCALSLLGKNDKEKNKRGVISVKFKCVRSSSVVEGADLKNV